MTALHHEMEECVRCSSLEQHNAELRARIYRLEQQAFFDPLTGLCNRRLFDEMLGKRIARADRYPQPGALLCLDIDDLKSVNDRHGHPAGDQLLVKLANILRLNVRASDVAARIGGDEFAILLDQISPQEIAEKVTALKSAIGQEVIDFDGQPVPFGAAIGGAVIMPGAKTKSVTAAADAAMYADKRNQRSER